jgi:hypothetical protein
MSDRREIAAGKAADPTAARASSSYRSGGWRPNWGGCGAGARSCRRDPDPDPDLGCPSTDACGQACSHNGNPDRYAAAICITVRPDRLLLGYSGDESWRLRRYPDATRLSSNGYFFFFLADFFAFFAFFAFLAMLPSVTPKLAQCTPTFDMHSFRLHHDYKIDTASFKEGKRPAISSRLAPRAKPI